MSETITPPKHTEIRLEIIQHEQTPNLPPFEVSDVKEWIKQKQLLLDKILDLGRKNEENCIALAANQIGIIGGTRITDRLFVLRNNYPHPNAQWTMVINPIIKEYLGVPRIKAEGCMTWGMGHGFAVIAERYPAICVSYYNVHGDFYDDVVVKGFMAQVWQHEINHLNGVEEEIKDVRDPNDRFKTIPVILPKPILERNMKCPCNSGKKFKNCCIQWEN